MNGELLGLGRTWWMCIIVIVGSMIGLVLGKIDSAMAKELIIWALGVGGLKSTAVGVAGVIKKNGG